MRITAQPARRWWAMLAAMIVLTLGACSATTESAPQMDPAGDSMPAGDLAAAAPENLREEGGTDAAPGDAAAMLIVTKTMRLEVPAADESVDDIRALAVERQGSVTDMEVASDDGWVYPKDEGRARGLRAWMTVRVPAGEYEAFVTDVAGLGELLSQSEASSDVTQEHIDLSARLQNLRAQEERLREFFSEAANVTEMLAIETELGRVRGDIESLDAQVKHLERKAAMVTVNIHLSEPADLVDSAGGGWGFTEALTDGLRGAVELVNGMVAFLIATSPLWIIGLIVFFPVRAWLRRRRKPTAAPVTE